MYCIKCGTFQEERLGKISFRAECDFCGASLHSCVHCKYYKIGLPNDCQIPGTERIVDREAANFCDEFAPLPQPTPKSSASDAKKRFDDLFK